MVYRCRQPPLNPAVVQIQHPTQFLSPVFITINSNHNHQGSTAEDRVNISTVLLLEDMGADYTIVRRFTVEAIPGRDCRSGGQCCVSWNLSAENQFEVNSSYHYGEVDLPVGPDMRQTTVIDGRPGYLLTTAEYTDTLSKSGESGRPGYEANGAPYPIAVDLHLVISY